MSNDHLKSDEDVEQILSLAIREEGLSDDTALRARLNATASELGISPEALIRAEEKYSKQKLESDDIQEFEQQAKREFYTHLTSYVLVNAFLVILNMMTSSHMWAHWSILGWGLGLAFHFVHTFVVKSDDYESDLAKWRMKKAEREVKEELHREVRDRIRHRHRP